MIEAKVKYVGHSDYCHPETCNCEPYAVQVSGTIVATFWKEKSAKESAAVLNHFFKEIKEGTKCPY